MTIYPLHYFVIKLLNQTINLELTNIINIFYFSTYKITLGL